MRDIKALLTQQRRFYCKGITRKLDFRIEQLNRLHAAVKKKEPVILEALRNDLNKSEFEGYLTEIGLIYDEIKHAARRLPRWARPQKVPTPFYHFWSRSRIYSEPYGVCLIIAPWNYPFQLAISPLIGAMAAGNCAVVKPSELAPQTSRVITELIHDTFEPEYIAAVAGGIDVSQALLAEPFDYLFFTGSVAVGKHIMAAAANHLTPVTLELGGKSPCIVDHDAPLAVTARRIVAGKFVNAGQTCVAPDYLFVHQSIKDDLLRQIETTLIDFYGPRPMENQEYPKIINARHFARLQNLLNGCKVRFGGEMDPERLSMAPTVIEDVQWQDPIMQEEIFGPLLPVLTFETLSQVIAAVNAQPKPLALYYFSQNRARQQRMVRSIPFGGGCINDTLLHVASPYLPFGGVGPSGMGHYHGKASFDTFSHQKSILNKSFRFDMPLRYPPYKNKISLLRRMFR